MGLAYLAGLLGEMDGRVKGVRWSGFSALAKVVGQGRIAGGCPTKKRVSIENFNILKLHEPSPGLFCLKNWY